MVSDNVLAPHHISEALAIQEAQRAADRTGRTFSVWRCRATDGAAASWTVLDARRDLPRACGCVLHRDVTPRRRPTPQPPGDGQNPEEKPC